MRKINKGIALAAVMLGVSATTPALAVDAEFDRFFDNVSGFNTGYFNRFGAGLPPGFDFSDVQISSVFGGIVETRNNTLLARPSGPGPFSFVATINGTPFSVMGVFRGNPASPPPPPDPGEDPIEPPLNTGELNITREFDGASSFSVENLLRGIQNDADDAMSIAVVDLFFGSGEVSILPNGRALAKPDAPGLFQFVVTFDNGLQRVVSVNFATPS